MSDFKRLTKTQIVALLKKLACRLRRVPTYHEFRRLTHAGQRRITQLFGGYRELLERAGFTPRGPGYLVGREELLLDWAAVVRKLRKIPGVKQYEARGSHGQATFARHWPSWHDVPAAFLELASAQSIHRKWSDVASLAAAHLERRRHNAALTHLPKAVRLSPARVPRNSPKPRSRSDSKTIFGRPMVLQAMLTHPVNEAGVLALFSSMAVSLGFSILKVQTRFPDVIALRLCKDGNWRLVRIELEFESRSFIPHGHRPEGCDLIVCWKHNWKDCPVEVIELSKLFAE
jgi:hypothetical protein